ncbi:MAG: ATP synthase F1 subunit gamma [Bacillota bacterium]|nr:ATP synthase F1 subunit gamma [Bacillota bacterium]MDI7249568.1 ATP synthase F1 subunit gamma [Bacillota bacterium]
MAGILEIRRRVRAVKNIQQVTRAMQMVAAAKLRRSQERLLAARPYAAALEEIIADLARRGPLLDHPFFRPQGGPVAYLVVGGDRGLCGAYNMNVVRHALDGIAARGDEVMVIAAGRRVRDFLRRRGVSLEGEYAPLGEEIELKLARVVADRLGNAFAEGRCRELRVIFTRYVSAGTQQVEERVLLPLEAPAEEQKRAMVEYHLEPSPRVAGQFLLPRYLQVEVYRLLLEAKTSEHAARMRAMANATDNAEEMITELTMEMNRERQAGITREIAEIVGGAEALK